MTWFDLTVCAIVGLSLLLGLVRGVVRELLGLVAWVAALLLARALAPAAAAWLPVAVRPEVLRLGIAFVAVMVLALVVLAVITMLVSALIKAAGLSLADRVLGAVFGVVRGLLIVLVAVVVAGLTPVPRDTAWRSSVLVPAFETAALWLSPWLPVPIGSRLKYTRSDRMRAFAASSITGFPEDAAPPGGGRRGAAQPGGGRHSHPAPSAPARRSSACAAFSA